jgi:hypothetical protein
MHQSTGEQGTGDKKYPALLIGAIVMARRIRHPVYWESDNRIPKTIRSGLGGTRPRLA